MWLKSNLSNSVIPHNYHVRRNIPNLEIKSKTVLEMEKRDFHHRIGRPVYIAGLNCGTTGQKGRGRKKETRDSETVVVTAGNWRNFAEGKLAAVIKSGSFVVPVESRPQPISPWISPLLELDGRGGGWNYEKSLKQESDSDWPEEQTRRPAKNNLLNALSVRAIVPDKTTDVYIYAIQGRSSKKGITPA